MEELGRESSPFLFMRTPLCFFMTRAMFEKVVVLRYKYRALSTGETHLAEEGD